MQAVPFFDDSISTNAHSATAKDHLNPSVTIAEFANGEPVSLYKTKEGELMCRTPGNKRFIEGPENLKG